MKFILKLILTLFLVSVVIFSIVLGGTAFLFNGEAKKSYYLEENNKLYVVQLNFDDKEYKYFIGNNERYLEEGNFAVNGDELTLTANGRNESTMIIKYDSQNRVSTLNGKIANDEYQNKEFKYMKNFINWFKLIIKYGQETT